RCRRAISRWWGMQSWTRGMSGRASSRRRCASSTTCCGSSTSTARAGTAWCRTRGARSCATGFAARAGTSSSYAGAGACARASRGPAASAARKALVATADGGTDPAVDRLLADVPDETLGALLADVGGHDLAAILAAYEEAAQPRRGPCVILADTIKGWGYPFAADQLNHGALLTQK